MERLTTSLYSLGAKLFVVCAGPRKVRNLEFVNDSIVHFTNYLLTLESYGRHSTLVYLPREILLLHYIKPYTLGNQQGVSIKQFLAPLLGTPIFKIGELHAMFYHCFLVFLVYLSVFVLVSFIKNHKKIACPACCYYGYH